MSNSMKHKKEKENIVFHLRLKNSCWDEKISLMVLKQRAARKGRLVAFTFSCFLFLTMIGVSNLQYSEGGGLISFSEASPRFELSFIEPIEFETFFEVDF